MISPWLAGLLLDRLSGTYCLHGYERLWTIRGPIPRAADTAAWRETLAGEPLGATQAESARPPYGAPDACDLPIGLRLFPTPADQWLALLLVRQDPRP